MNKRKWLALLLCVAVALTMFPIAALAEDDTGLCPHHAKHTAECGYAPAVAGQPCTHEHTEACWTTQTVCTHAHTAECYPGGALPGEGEDIAPTCGHVCTEESGCVTSVLACPHTHDAACGYVAAAEAKPCTFVCAECDAKTPPTAIVVTGWAWADAEYLDEETGGLAMPCASEETPAGLADVIALLPTAITATAEGQEEPLNLTLAGWRCDGYPEAGAYEGTYTFTAALPDGYALAEGASPLTVPVLLGGGAMWDIANSVPYIDASGNAQTCASATVVTDSDAEWTSGWYVVNSNVTNSNRIKVSGYVNLILADGCTLNATSGILVASGNSIIIYGQSQGTGKLIATAWTDGGDAGIGSKHHESGTGAITINGGIIEATGHNGGAGIGGGHGTPCTSITINGGNVTATGGACGYSGSGAGIGCGYTQKGGSVIINGGVVNANGNGMNGENAPGIGGGSTLNGATDTTSVTITGGTVTANGFSGSKGISGDFKATGNAVIYASSINDTSSGDAWNGIIFMGNTGTVYGDLTLGEDLTIPSGKTLTIPAGSTLTIPEDVTLTIPEGVTLTNNGTIINYGTIIGTVTGNPPKNGVKYLDEKGEEKTALCDTEITAEYLSANSNELSTGWYVVKGGVTAGSRIKVSGDVHLILADGCNLNANNGIAVNSGNSLTIYAQSTDESTMGSLTAVSTSGNKAGIGGDSSDSGTITINGGKVTATGGQHGGAGIGGGYLGSGGSITINGGKVTATGGSNGAGIGGGYLGSGGSITINGGKVEAKGGSNGAGIGGGNNGSGGTININGGKVEAKGGSNGACIGGGINGSGGTITINGGKVEAKGGTNGAGIGGGCMGSGGTFKTTDNGNAVIFASSISDQSGKTSNTWRGVIFENSDGKVYGSSITPAVDFTIETGKNLLIPEGSTLKISVLNASNNGNVYVAGTLDGSFIGDSCYYPLTVTGGAVEGTSTYNNKVYGKANSDYTLPSAEVPVGQKFERWEPSVGTVEIKDNMFKMPAEALTIEAVYSNAPAYTVTIPATVALGETATVSATGVSVASGSNLVVKLTDAGSFTLTSAEGAALSYSITCNNATVGVNDTLLTVAGGTANSSGSAQLSFSQPTTPVKYSGSYTGSMTFTVSVEQAPQP